ncbi:hypothetical protein SteCoe_6682 [Stentor coeruleus]|uniref:CH-like domain-containing protein n=1 Tax=Stentor coeruleus TaxID=5963 RepID=A0A1R2CPI0_9CILI|nr:hypothetical protein SteCoe_6682 [Stentor coeruleus]
MGTVPREVIKWLHSLDLAYSIKNPRRDFSNGFLIAEIFSKFFPQEIKMHSFDTGLSISAKISNWGLLEAFFRKKNLNIFKRDWDPVLYSAPDAAISLLKKVYEFLTNKQVEEPPVKPKVHPKAGFANTSIPKDPDTKSVQSKTHQIFAEEITEDDEIPAGEPKITLRKIPHGNTKQLDKNNLRQLQGIEIREVEVKQIDRNFAQIRATKSMSMQKSMNEPSFVASAKGIETVAKHPYSTNYELTSSLSKPINEIMSDLVMEALSYTQRNVSEIAPDITAPELGKYFFAHLEDMSPDMTAAFFEYMAKKIPIIADISLKNPHEFWMLFSLAFPAIERLIVSSDQFLHLMETLCLVGEKMASLDPSGTESLFYKYVLGKSSDLMLKNPGKRDVLCHLLYSYIVSDPTARTRAIQKLSEQLPGYHELVKCLAIFIKYDKEYNEDLHDVFIYYGLLGLEHSSAYVRTAAIAIFSQIANLNHIPILSIVPQLKALSQDRWWEVRGQVIQCAGTLLSILDPNTEESNMLETLHGLKEVVYTAFTPTDSKNVLRIGLIYIAPALHKYPELGDRYVECLLAVRDDIRRSLLEMPDDSQTQTLMEEGMLVLGASTQRYKIKSCLILWKSSVVALALANNVKQNRLENLEEAHVDVLFACMQGQLDDKEIWIEVFEKLKDHLCVALCEPELCVKAQWILKKFFTSSETFETTLISSKDILLKALCYVFTKKEENSMIVSEELLKSLYTESGVKMIQDFVKMIVKNFQEKYPDVYANSPMGKILS